MKADDPRHGTRSGYTRGCRNTCCRNAASAYENRRRLAQMAGQDLLVDRQGAVRRLRALQALGWSGKALSAELGRGPSYVSVLLTRLDNDKVTIKVHNEVDALFRRLCMTPGPSSLTRIRAKSAGWQPPLAWDDIDNDLNVIRDEPTDTYVDTVLIERLLAGDPTSSRSATPAERKLVINRWAGSLAELERLTGWNVHRYAKKCAA